MNIVWLDKPGDNTGSLGSKAQSLTRLVGAGTQVPRGFVVPADMQLDGQSDTILEAFDALHAEYVAVRSSGMAEDGDSDAWAGQLDTFLNVGRGALVEKIKACRESANSERAQAYAEQKGLKSKQHVAVIVQEMIQADVAGVVFSRHPVTGTDDIIIEAAWGLGEAVVSGSVTPDTYIVGRDSAVRESQVSTQKDMIVLDEDGGGTETVSVADDRMDTQKLQVSQIAELAERVVVIEKIYGKPVDVEWLFKGDTLFITQARPITT